MKKKSEKIKIFVSATWEKFGCLSLNDSQTEHFLGY